MIQFQLTLPKPFNSRETKDPRMGRRGSEQRGCLSTAPHSPGFRAPSPAVEFGPLRRGARAAPTEAAVTCRAGPALHANRGALRAQCRPGGDRSRYPRGPLAAAQGSARLQRADPPPVAGDTREAPAAPTMLRSSPAGAAAAGPGMLPRSLPGEARPVRSWGLGWAGAEPRATADRRLRRFPLPGARAREARGALPRPGSAGAAGLRLSQSPGGAGEPGPAAERGL